MSAFHVSQSNFFLVNLPFQCHFQEIKVPDITNNYWKGRERGMEKGSRRKSSTGTLKEANLFGLLIMDHTEK